MELFPTSKNLSVMDFLYTPQNGYHRHSDLPTLVKSSSVKESKASQLTIFYDGQVVVFDDFPADKVNEIMALANKIVSQSQNPYAFVDTHNQKGNNHPSIIVPSTIPQAPPTPIVYEMPVARKNSLHRFLAKRKNRIVANAPYQKENPNAALNKPA